MQANTLKRILRLTYTMTEMPLFFSLKYSGQVLNFGNATCLCDVYASAANRIISGNGNFKIHLWTLIIRLA